MGLTRARSTLIAGQSAVAAALTGTTNETTLASLTIPGGTIGPNGQVEVVTLWSYTNSANAKTLRVKMGGSTFSSISATTTVMSQNYTRIANRNSHASQISTTSGTAGIGTSASAVNTATVDTSADVTIAFTATLASAGETITLESYIVKVFPKG